MFFNLLLIVALFNQLQTNANQCGTFRYNGGCQEHFSSLISQDKTGLMSFDDCCSMCASNSNCKSFSYGRSGVSRENWCNIYNVVCTDNADTDWNTFTPDIPTNSPIVEQFAPILKFDNSAQQYGYPMNAQIYVDNGCDDGAICTNSMLDTTGNPTYYRVLSSDDSNGNFDVLYWFFYGHQYECFGDWGWGSHRGDWERVIVHIKNWGIDSVTFYQHSGHYTTSDINRNGDRVIVFIGKQSHGSYFDGRDGIGGGCGYFYDWRNPGPSLNTWNNLINLETSTDNWIINNIKVPRDCCSNPLTDKTNTFGCDDCGCNYRNCDDDWQLIFNPIQCIAC